MTFSPCILHINNTKSSYHILKSHTKHCITSLQLYTGQVTLLVYSFLCKNRNRYTVANSSQWEYRANMLLMIFSVSAWLAAYEHPVVDHINQRIEDITGLDVKTAEELQVVFMRLLMHKTENNSVLFLSIYNFISS